MKPFIALLLLAAWPNYGASFELQIEAPAGHSENAIVTAQVPKEFPTTGHLTSGSTTIPFQKNPRGEIVFVGSFETGQAVSWAVKSSRRESRIAADRKEGKIHIHSDGKPLFVYQGHESDLPRPDIKELFKRGGYLHPVYSPSGKVVTDDYPPNHVHHHGIWFPWTKTEFQGRSPDFWNMGQGKGKIEFIKFGEQWSGPVHAGFVSHHQFIDLTSGEPKAVLNETWTVSAYALPDAKITVFDLISTQECATASALKLPQYHYGGLGFRGNWAWNGPNACHFLTSNGETDRIKGNETRGNWCYIGGALDGGQSGIAILSHPENFRAPQPMRLHPTEPFFCFAPSQLGDWAIEPGQPYVSKYRFVVMDGPPRKDAIDDLWQSYANPPKVTVKKLSP